MPKTRNILFLQSSSEYYGSGKIILQVLDFYKNQGLSPIVILTGPGLIEAELKAAEIPFYIQNLGILRRKYANPGGLLNRLNKNLQAYRFLSRLHKKYQFELVYSNTLAVVVGAYWAKKKGLPHVWHIHEIIPGPAPLVSWLSGLLDSSTSKPIAVSQAVADHWQPLLKKAKIEVIHNGIPYDEFLDAKAQLREELGISFDQILVGMIGRINPGKGQLFFLQLAKSILKNHPQVHFVLVGDPFPGYESILEEMKETISQNGLSDKISYLGFRQDIPQIMASLDIFVLPSILPDSFPTVILEAMASGTPVLATQSGGASEMVIDGDTGYLIPIGNIEKGSSALEKLISEPEIRSKMGEAGRNRVLATYSLEAFEEKIINHLWQHLKRN